jgi:hypothetical protein
MKLPLTLISILFVTSTAPLMACPGSGSGLQTLAPDGDVTTGDDVYASAARTYGATANGEFEIGGCGGDLANLDGYFTTQPALDFELSYLGGYTLNIAVSAECPAAMLVYDHAYGSWSFSDIAYVDSNAKAEVSIMNPADGIYSVWVGTSDGSSCEAAVRLSTD